MESGKYAGRTCLILGAGPSLGTYKSAELAEIAENKVVFAIKQAYIRIPHLVRYHFINDNNFTPVQYSPKTEVIVGLPSNNRVQALMNMAHHTFFIENNWDFSRSLSFSHNFDDWTLDKQPVMRPWGPGILYEIVFFAAHHMGFSSIETIGWDLGPKGSLTRRHFYDNVKPKLLNPAAPLNVSEAEREIELTKKFNEWFRNQGISLTILNDGSYAHESIQRA